MHLDRTYPGQRGNRPGTDCPPIAHRQFINLICRILQYSSRGVGVLSPDKSKSILAHPDQVLGTVYLLPFISLGHVGSTPPPHWSIDHVVQILGSDWLDRSSGRAIDLCQACTYCRTYLMNTEYYNQANLLLNN